MAPKIIIKLPIKTIAVNKRGCLLPVFISFLFTLPAIKDEIPNGIISRTVIKRRINPIVA